MRSTSRAIASVSFVWPFLVAALSPITALAQAVAAPYTTAHWYDIAGRPTGTVEPCVGGVCPATRYDYNAAGLLSEEDDGALGGWPTNAPSQWTFSSISKIVTYGYDSMGRVAWTEVSTSARVPNKLTEYWYDAVGRVQCVAMRMNPSAGPTGNACALTAQGSADRITYTTYDPQNHPVDIYRGYLSPTSQHYAHYTYWLNGMEATVTDANGNLTSFFYDGLDRLSATQYPSTTTGAGTSQASDEEQCTSYDNDNNCWTKVTRDGQTIQYSYDALNRVTSKIAPNEQNVYYGYNLQNQRLYANFGSATGQGVANAYDGFGEMTSETVNLSGTPEKMSYQYDPDGNRTQVSYPDGIYIQYNYDGLDRLQTVLQNGTTSLATYSYDGNGRLGELSRAGGLAWTTYGYDGISRLNSLAHTFSSPANDVTYSITQYNADDQITSETISNSGYAVLATGSQSYTANGLNEYSAVGGTSFGYDGRGNLTGDASYNYSYDVENRLTGSSLNNTVLTYDPLGRLYEVSSSLGTTTFLYDGNRITAEYNGSGTLTNRYVYGIGGDDPIVWYKGSSVASPQYLFADHEGSIVAVTGSSGSVVAINQYDSYGQGGTSSQNQGRFQFTGQAYIPALNQYYYKARMYDPSLGRFMQTDPIGYEDDLDLYAYVGNDPVDGTDPSGTLCVLGYWDDFCERSRRYAKLAADPAIASHTNFFGAAAVVTNALGGWPQSKFMHDLSATLEKDNLTQVALIRSGKLYSGGTIEKNTEEFVHYEQTNVQKELDALQKRNPAEYASVIATANKDLNGTVSAIAKVTDPTFARADADARNNLHHDINFAHQQDREELGRDVAKELGLPRCHPVYGGDEVCSP